MRLKCWASVGNEFERDGRKDRNLSTSLAAAFDDTTAEPDDDCLFIAGVLMWLMKAGVCIVDGDITSRPGLVYMRLGEGLSGGILPLVEGW